MNICCPPTNSDETLSHQTNVVTLCALHFFHPPCCIQKTSAGLTPCFLALLRNGQFWVLRRGMVWLVAVGVQAEGHMVSEESHKQWAVDLLLIAQKSVVHQLAGSLSHYLQRSIHPRWLLGISEPSTVGHLLYTRDSPFTQGLFHKTWRRVKGPFTNQSQLWWKVTS